MFFYDIKNVYQFNIPIFLKHEYFVICFKLMSINYSTKKNVFVTMAIYDIKVILVMKTKILSSRKCMSTLWTRFNRVSWTTMPVVINYMRTFLDIHGMAARSWLGASQNFPQFSRRGALNNGCRIFSRRILEKF